MRSFYFTAKNIGRERYLTYVMGEGMEMDEDIVDYLEENVIAEVLPIIFEQDDDFDYLTYDVTGKMTVEKFVEGVMNKEKVFKLLRYISLGLINCKENAIPLSYILLNKRFIYIDPDSMFIEFLCLPVESEGSVSLEFKSFVRQLIAAMKYNVEEDLSYVGQLLSYINGDSFNLRGLIELTEALMQDSGIDYTASDDITMDDGSEVVSGGELGEEADKSVSGFMNDLSEAGDLPEIGDDDDEDIEDVTEEVEEENDVELEEVEAEDEEAPAEEAEVKDATDVLPESEIKSRIEEIGGSKSPQKATEPVIDPNKPVRVSRAAMIKQTAEEVAEEDAAAAAEKAEVIEENKGSKNAAEKKNTVIENMDEIEGKQPKPVKEDKASKGNKNKAAKAEKAPEKPKTEIVDNTMLGPTGTIKINPYIIRVNTEEKTMINKPVFKIGKANRGVDYHISGNGAISRQHAIILHKGDSYYIKDNKSTNHTYVDDVEVTGDEEVLLKNNCTFKLGDEEFIFKIS